MVALRRRPSARFYLWHVGLPLALAIVALVLFEQTDIDRRVTDIFYDAAAQRFPLRHAWFLEAVMHHWAKYLLVVTAFGAFAGFLLSFALPELKALRARLLFVFLVMTCGPAGVRWLSSVSNEYCPNDLAVYGGFAPYRHTVESPAPNIEPGHCWPDRQASGGFSLLAFYFGWRARHRRLALAALGIGVACGLAFGAGRLAQGAHFLSHIVWSGIVVWGVALVLYRVLLYPGDETDRIARHPPTNGAHESTFDLTQARAKP